MNAERERERNARCNDEHVLQFMHIMLPIDYIEWAHKNRVRASEHLLQIV